MILNLNTPLLAVHILFVNLVTDTFPALALGVDPASANIMKNKPVKNGSLFEKGLITRIVFYGLLIASISLIAFFIGYRQDYKTAITMSFTVICLSQIVHALNQHSSTISIFSKKHLRNKYLYLAMLVSTILLAMVLFIPPIRDFFSLCNLTIFEWQFVLILSLSPLLVVELFKFLRRHYKKLR